MIKRLVFTFLASCYNHSFCAGTASFCQAKPCKTSIGKVAVHLSIRVRLFVAVRSGNSSVRMATSES